MSEEEGGQMGASKVCDISPVCGEQVKEREIWESERGCEDEIKDERRPYIVHTFARMAPLLQGLQTPSEAFG